MPNIGKNIEALSTKTTVDMWDQIYMSQVPKFLTFYDGASYKIRMLGDFVVASRHYIPNDTLLADVLSKEDLEAIVRGNETVYNKIIDTLFESLDENAKKIISKIRNEDTRTFNDARTLLARNPVKDSDGLTIKRIKEIDSIFASSSWSRCYLVNCMIREQGGIRMSSSIRSGEVVVLPITNQIMQGIFASCKTIYGANMNGVKLGGINAHDIHISRTNLNNRGGTRSYGPGEIRPERDTYQGYKRYNWTINMSPSPEHLTQPEISSVIKYGVYDLSEAAKYTNRNTSIKKSGFLYRLFKKTMNNTQMVNEICGEQEGSDFAQHVDLADKNLSNLPETAFSNRMPQGAIGSLEL